MSRLMPVLAVAGAVVASIGWLRVAQREHYLAGSILAMRRTWIGSLPINAAEPVLVAAGAIGYWIRPDSLWPVLGVAAIVIFPLGLSLRGRTSPLVWTARLRRTVAIGAALLVGGAVLGAWLITLLTDGTWPGALTLAVVIVWYLTFDAALWLSGPLERRLSQSFVDQASLRLAGVAPLVVGITGSYGKTSTKGYVRDLVEGSKRVVASPASFNNRLGLARAVNDHLTGDAQVFVAEMGAYGPGEIGELCSWLRPSIAVLTAIGPVHLQRFKTEERIVAAKSEMIGGAAAVVLNADHPALARLAGRVAPRRVWRCGTSEAATDVRIHEQDGELMVVARGEWIPVNVPTGIFPANLACAVAVALELGVRPEEIADRIARLTPTEHRQSIGRSSSGLTIIDDTFNSNPTGAARALEMLAQVGDDRTRRVVITPGMVELGPRQRDENARFAAAAAGIADELVIVGRTNRRALLRGAKAGSATVIQVKNREKAVEWVRTHLGPDDAVLYENDLPDHYP